jgi:putative ABC transport system ATP-binding protein
VSEAIRALGEPAAAEGSQPCEVDFDAVVKVYPGGVRALDRVDLRIAEGEYVTVTGPSGCGKSTMLHLAAALDVPTSGTVRIGGRDLSAIPDLSSFRRNQVGLIFQLHNLIPGQPIIANVEAVMFGTHRSGHERRNRAMELLARVDLAGREHRLPTQLSGGERQRVAIARALANEPRLLLADEPTGSLDPAAADLVLQLFERVRRRGVTIVMVTHDPGIARLADRTIYMREGRIVEPGL